MSSCNWTQRLKNATLKDNYLLPFAPTESAREGMNSINCEQIIVAKVTISTRPARKSKFERVNFFLKSAVLAAWPASDEGGGGHKTEGVVVVV